MKYIFTYFKIAILIIFDIAVWGFLCPYLISANDDLFVVLGFVSLIVSLPINGVGIWNMVKDFIKLYKSLNNKIGGNE
jgi:hypothetical protein